MCTIYQTKLTGKHSEAQRTETISSMCLVYKRRIWIPILNINRVDTCKKMLDKASGVSDFKSWITEWEMRQGLKNSQDRMLCKMVWS